jgi:phosphatidylglycerophosphatase A
MNKIVMLLATGLGLGCSPVAPGTVASVLGVGIAIGLGGLPIGVQVAAAIALAGAAVPVCGAAERHFGVKDDHRIVADEYLTFPLCTLGLPWQTRPWLLVVAFAAHRALDIVKPPPARQAQHLPGGWGIVLDDVASSLYALGLSHLVCRLVETGGG